MMTTTSSSSGTGAPSSPAYLFPPIYSFAPFFTLQRNDQTLASQLQLWTRFVVDYCAAKRLFVLDADAADGSSDGGEIFSNSAIGRGLDRAARRKVLKHLVDEGRGAWVGISGGGGSGGGSGYGSKVWGRGTTAADEAGGDRALVFWKRPDEWGEIIYQWVVATGQNRSIMTFFELTEGDLVQSTEFRGMPILLLRLALATLEKTGRAKVFEGSESGESMTGVKFA